MKKIIVTYAMTGGFTFEVESEEEARKLFDEMSESELYDNATSAEITEVFEEIE